MRSRWRLFVRDEAGNARLVLTDNGVPIGVGSMIWPDYVNLLRESLRLVTEVAVEALAGSLQKIIWRDALAACEGNSEIAKERLAALGWTEPGRFTRVAGELGLEVGKALISLVPQHRPAIREE